MSDNDDRRPGRDGQTGDAMSLDRFAAMIEAYGAAEARWPEAERRAAQSLVAVSADAAHLLAEARALDEFLDAAPEITPHAELRETILRAAPPDAMDAGVRTPVATRPLRLSAAFAWLRRRWAPAGALGGALAGGVAAGFFSVTFATAELSLQPEDEFALYTSSLSALAWTEEVEES